MRCGERGPATAGRPCARCSPDPPPPALPSHNPSIPASQQNPAQAGFEAAYWGENYKKLSEIKAKYDPLNVFGKPITVAPAVDA